MFKLLDRVAAAGGLLFVLLTAVGYIAFVAPHIPESLASPDAVLAHLRENPPTASFWAGVWLEGAGLAALVLFAARQAARLRAADPTGWLPSAVVGFAVAAFTVKLASFAPAMAALHVDRYDAGTVTALLDINDAAFDVSWALDGVFVLLLGLGAWATRALPRWVAGWAVLAGLSILVGIALGPVFDVLQPVFLLWLLAASGWLLARGGRAPTEAAAPPVPQPTAHRP